MTFHTLTQMQTKFKSACPCCAPQQNLSCVTLAERVYSIRYLSAYKEDKTKKNILTFAQISFLMESLCFFICSNIFMSPPSCTLGSTNIWGTTFSGSLRSNKLKTKKHKSYYNSSHSELNLHRLHVPTMSVCSVYSYESIENIDSILFWAINIPSDQSESGLNLMALIGRRWSVWIISRSSLSSDVLSGLGFNVYTAFYTAFNNSDIFCELTTPNPPPPPPRLFLCCENKMRKGRFLNCIEVLLCAHREERTRSVKHRHGPGKPWGWGRDTCRSFISL